MGEAGSSDKQFWQLVKEISGLEQHRNPSAPSADDLADHFQHKMSNAKGEVDTEYSMSDDLVVPLSSFKIRFKVVLKVLLSRDPSNLPMASLLCSSRNVLEPCALKCTSFPGIL